MPIESPGVKRLLRVALLAGVALDLGACVYGPGPYAYYSTPAYYAPTYVPYYAPSYYYPAPVYGSYGFFGRNGGGGDHDHHDHDGGHDHHH